MRQVTVGVDPGLKGGLAALVPDGGKLILETIPMPSLKVGKYNEVDELGIADWLRAVAATTGADVHVFIEKVHSMPKQGVRSTFTFGTGYGAIRGVCAGLGVPRELVTPQEWKKAMLGGQPEDSEASVARGLWPNHDWKATERCRVPHTGMVAAALIAEHGRRKARR